MSTESLMIFNDPKMPDQYASFQPDTVDGKIKLYNAINSPDERLADVINMPIILRDVVITKVQLSEEMNKPNDKNPFAVETNENKAREGFRVILIDTEDKSYTATSAGVYNSVCTMRNVFGTLHFDEGLKVMVKQIKTKNGNTLTISIAQ